MRKLALYPVCFIAGLTFAIFPRIADAIVLFWQAVLLAVAVVCVVALCWFAVLFLYRRSVNASGTPQTSQETPEHTEHGYSIPPIEQAALQGRWNASALQLAVISRHKLGSYSSRSLFPYIQSNKRVYWEYFRDEMIRLGFVVQDAKRGFVWNGSYRRFSSGLKWGLYTIAPSPDMPPPTVLWVSGDVNTPDTLRTVDTVRTLGESVFIG